jgi:hypoxanthine phosphoribosyltransferase
MAKKILISPQDYYQSCFRLAEKVVDSGYRPSIIYGIHRGGATAENVLYEIFSWLGIEVKLAAAITQSYYGTEQNSEKIVKIGGYTLMPDEIWPGSKILLVEDLVDSGRSLGAIIADILDQNQNMKRDDIKVAVLDYKKLENHQFPKTIRFRRMYEQDRNIRDAQPLQWA